MSVRRTSLVTVALAVTLAGCSGEPSFPDLIPFTGTVTQNGQPVKGGGLIFLPESSTGSGAIVNASVGSDGTFAAETSQTSRAGVTTIKPGAPAGRYRVVYHPLSDGSRSGLEVELTERVEVSPQPAPVTLTLPAVLPKGHGAERDDAPKPPGEKAK